MLAGIIGSLITFVVIATITAIWTGFGRSVLRVVRPPVVIEARPPTAENIVKLLVINRDKTQDFQADVIDFEGIAGPAQEPYQMKWRAHERPVKRILAGGDADLDVARIEPPVRDPYRVASMIQRLAKPPSLRDSEPVKVVIRRGSFHLFSASQPKGWSVSAGFPNDIATMEDVMNAPEPVDEKIALKVRITGSEKISTTRRVTLGFDRPFEVDTFAPHSPVRIHVDKWPRPASKLWAGVRALRLRR